MVLLIKWWVKLASNIILSPIGRNGEDRTIWEVIKPINLFFSFMGDTYKAIIHEGFLTDGGSIPSIGEPFISSTDPDYLLFFLFHDLLYEKSGRILVFKNGRADILNLTRAQADKISLWDMPKRAGVPYWKRAIVYPAVVIGGGKAWRKMKSLKRGQRYKMLRKFIK